MDNSFLKILINPNLFFQDKIKENESLKIPALIVLISAIAGAAAAYQMVTPTVKLMGSMVAGMEIVIILAAVIATFVITFISWLVFAGIFFILSTMFKGKGTFNRTLEIVGYGFLPQIMGGIITVIVALEYIPNVMVQSIPAGTTDSQVIHDATTNLMRDPAMMAFTQITTLISIVFLLWSANIWIFGMQHARKLSPRDAALSVGIPVVLYVLYMVYSITVM
jgi:hypothetical protein